MDFNHPFENMPEDRRDWLLRAIITSDFKAEFASDVYTRIVNTPAWQWPARLKMAYGITHASSISGMPHPCTDPRAYIKAFPERVRQRLDSWENQVTQLTTLSDPHSR